MLTSRAQQIVLAISNYLINLLFNTGDIYSKTLRLKALSDTLNTYLYAILDYAVSLELLYANKQVNMSQQDLVYL